MHTLHILKLVESLKGATNAFLVTWKDSEDHIASVMQDLKDRRADKRRLALEGNSTTNAL